MHRQPDIAGIGQGRPATVQPDPHPHLRSFRPRAVAEDPLDAQRGDGHQDAAVDGDVGQTGDGHDLARPDLFGVDPALLRSSDHDRYLELGRVVTGEVMAQVPLPIAGLMSEQPLEVVASQVADLIQVSHQLGVELDNPFMALSFLALPVIPSLKLTDQGLVDVEQFKLVPLFVE